MNDTTQARILVVGAHPDDCEFHAGGLICHGVRSGAMVKMIAMTDGSAGHYKHDTQTIRRLRDAEAKASARQLGAQVEIWETLDGYLEPTLVIRDKLIAAIRAFGADIIVSHRTNDYHPDHRATGQLVQDACFLSCVPLILPDVTALESDPTVLFMADKFSQPLPLRPDIAVNYTEILDDIVRGLNEHKTQVYEFLPRLIEQIGEVSTDPAERLVWLKHFLGARANQNTRHFLPDMAGSDVWEVFEVSEYGSPLNEERLAKLLPFAVPTPAYAKVQGRVL